ncbi:hypothetical protein STEG23_001242 [Scotinomys teguina]
MRSVGHPPGLPTVGTAKPRSPALAASPEPLATSTRRERRPEVARRPESRQLRNETTPWRVHWVKHVNEFAEPVPFLTLAESTAEDLAPTTACNLSRSPSRKQPLKPSGLQIHSNGEKGEVMCQQ